MRAQIRPNTNILTRYIPLNQSTYEMFVSKAYRAQSPYDAYPYDINKLAPL